MHRGRRGRDVHPPSIAARSKTRGFREAGIAHRRDDNTKSHIDLTKAFDQVVKLRPKRGRFALERSELRYGDRFLHGAGNSEDGRRHRRDGPAGIGRRIAALCRRAIDEDFRGLNMLFEFEADFLMV